MFFEFFEKFYIRNYITFPRIVQDDKIGKIGLVAKDMLHDFA